CEQLPVWSWLLGPVGDVRLVRRLDHGLDLSPGVETATGGGLVGDRRGLGCLGAEARRRQDAQALPLVDRLRRHTEGGGERTDGEHLPLLAAQVLDLWVVVP